MNSIRILSFNQSQKLSLQEVGLISASSAPATWCASATGGRGSWDVSIDCSTDV